VSEENHKGGLETESLREQRLCIQKNEGNPSQPPELRENQNDFPTRSKLKLETENHRSTTSPSKMTGEGGKNHTHVEPKQGKEQYPKETKEEVIIKKNPKAGQGEE